MRLKNKKTGEVVEISNIGLVWNRHGMPADIGRYDSLAELNEEWEDYKHKKPKTDQDIIKSLKSENAYLRGIIGVYEKFLKDRGYIKEEE